MGLWGVHPGGASRLLDVEPVVFLAFLEGLAREDEESASALDEMYRSARPKPLARRRSPDERRAEIARFARLTGGSTS